MVHSPQDVYARHLVSGRGYPLWTPEPSMSLPDVYVREGLKIGDVGVVVPEDGSFDVFFNVCLPPTHSLHRETGVPNNFTHIPLSGRDITIYPEAEGAGRIISTSSVARVRNTNESDEDPARQAQPGPLNYEFTLSSQEGAVLILPEGAERYYLRNERLFLDQAIQHAVDWYTFAEQRLGRIISHDSLYLITGFHKARSWSLAAYHQGSGQGEASAQFKAVQVGRGNIAASYTWETTRAMDWRVGPSDQYYSGIPNQTVFIQGFKIAIREGILGTKWVNVKADFPSVRPYRVDFSSGSWFSSLWGGGSGSSSGSTANTPKGTGTNVNMDTTESNLPVDESENIREDITIHRFPRVPKPFHPSDIINKHLLKEVPSATVAVTHDSQWTTLLERGLLEPGELSQKDRLIAGVTSNYSMVLAHEGATYLQSIAIGNDMNNKDEIEFQVSRLSIMDSHYDVRPMSALNPADPESEVIVDVGVAFGVPGSKKGTVQPVRVPSFGSQSQMSDNTSTLEDLSKLDSTRDDTSSDYTLVPSDGSSMSDRMSFNDDESIITRTAINAQKKKKIFGDDAPEHIVSTKPWYLWPDYTNNDMVIDVDGSVRAGTVPALVERLTSHEIGDPTFMKTFLMMYKSFTTLDKLFDLLVRRFYIQPPNNLTPTELEEWKKLKQHIIQMRVLNTFKAMIADDYFLENEDMYILDRMEKFLLQDVVSKIAISISKQLVILIDRARAGELKKTITPNLVFPPTSILPKAGKRVQLLDVHPLELARQLTILESQLYQRIRPMECLSRSREQKTDHNDNIALVIQTSNRIVYWVADAVLSQEDSRKRAAVLAHFILIADHCRFLHNYSSMVAIVSGVNSLPIRRLKRSWKQVNSRHMTQLNACEMTIDVGKNFTNYRSTLAKVAPPCVPFMGIPLTILTFIQDGSKDTLPGNLVNFRKRQKAFEVIQDIQRWQNLPHHFHPLSTVQMYIEESLGKFSDQVDFDDVFWNLSLEREPREREDEKTAGSLQESGFL